MNYKSFAHESHELDNINDFKKFIRTRTRSVLNHEMAVCGIGDLKNRRVIRLINIDFPDSYLNYVVQPNQAIQSHVVHKWIEIQQPILFHIDQANVEVNLTWLNVLKRCNIYSIASHGLVDPCSQCFSYFGFGNVDISTNNDIHAKLIELIPYLHYALTRVLTLKHNTANVNDYTDNASSFEKVMLCKKKENSLFVTPRELEVMSWISLGKKNEDIAHILGISQNTVNNHIKSLFKRLDVTSRAQAVSKAVSLSLI